MTEHKKLIDEARSANPPWSDELVVGLLRDLADALEAAEKAHTREVQTLRNTVKDYDTNFPCDGGCNTNDGPEETCSRHGRSPADLWSLIDADRAALAAFEKAHTSTDDEREVPKQEICERCGWAISAHARSQYGLDCPLGGVRPGFRRSEAPKPRFPYASEWEQPETIIERVLDDAGYDLFQPWRTGVVNAIAAWVNEAGRAVEPQGAPSDAQYPEIDAFAERMRAEMIANAHKGDNWQSMTPRQAWGEISWHIGKLTGAIKANDIALIRELAADVANGALMLDEIARTAGGVR